jgi:nitroreductase
MDYDELLTRRRSVRDYMDQSIATDVLKELIQESTLAPSSGNSQPWQFVIVNSRPMMKRLSDESKKNLLKRIEADPKDYLKKYENGLRNENFNVFYNAPALIIIGGPAGHRMLSVDCALFAVYFMNAAAARGFGTCWINLGSDIQDPALRQELGMEHEYKIIAPIVIGYPKSIPAAPGRERASILKIIE